MSNPHFPKPPKDEKKQGGKDEQKHLDPASQAPLITLGPIVEGPLDNNEQQKGEDVSAGKESESANKPDPRKLNNGRHIPVSHPDNPEPSQQRAQDKTTSERSAGLASGTKMPEPEIWVFDGRKCNQRQYLEVLQETLKLGVSKEMRDRFIDLGHPEAAFYQKPKGAK